MKFLHVLTVDKALDTDNNVSPLHTVDHVGLCDVEDPALSQMAVRLSDFTGRALLHRNIISLLLVLISDRG
jgi:hypothetical protein